MSPANRFTVKYDIHARKHCTNNQTFSTGFHAETPSSGSDLSRILFFQNKSKQKNGESTRSFLSGGAEFEIVEIICLRVKVSISESPWIFDHLWNYHYYIDKFRCLAFISKDDMMKSIIAPGLLFVIKFG